MATRDGSEGRLNELLSITSKMTPGSDVEYADGPCVSFSRSKSLFCVTIRGPFIRDGEKRQTDKSIEYFDVEAEGDNSKIEVILGTRKVWRLEIIGRNLLLLMDWLREHRANWIRVALGNGSRFEEARDGQPFIDAIRLTDVTPKARE